MQATKIRVKVGKFLRKAKVSEEAIGTVKTEAVKNTIIEIIAMVRDR